MGRRSRPARGRAPLTPHHRVEVGPDGDTYEVRPVAAAGAAKSYRCPGCDHVIGSGTAHVVAWPLEWGVRGELGVDDRRHWHTACWQHRATRGPTRRWS